MKWDHEDARFNVVIRHEEQDSIQAAFKDIPAGSKAADTEGTKQECVAHSESVRSDTWPLSMRRAEVTP